MAGKKPQNGHQARKGTREVLEEVEAECRQHHANLGNMLEKMRQIRHDFVGRRTVNSLALRDQLIQKVIADAKVEGDPIN